MSDTPAITLAITGASGCQYGLRLLQYLLAAGREVNLLISDAAQVVIHSETDLRLPQEIHAQQAFFNEWAKAASGRVRRYSQNDWFSPVASGSARAMPMVICPASGGTLAAIAQGASNNLIERAADVALKERRKLIIVPRETPLSEIHLENMLKLSRLGAVILPASPGFYHRPSTLEDLIDFIVARILDQLGVEQKLVSPWGSTD